MSSTELPPVSELIPHRGEVLLLERVLEHDPECTTVRVAVGASGWLRRSDGSAPSWLAVEYMAQCAAAHEGMLARMEGRPPPLGFLISARGLRLHGAHFGADEILRVRAARARGRPGLGALSHSCSIHVANGDAEGALRAEGVLSVSLAGPSPVTGGMGPGR